MIAQNSFIEVAHCGVDGSKPRLFTAIVGTKGDNPQFFCHVFKCESKDSAIKLTRAVAAGATEWYRRVKQLAAEETTRQRKRNQSAGYGMVTNAERDAQVKANTAAGFGALTDPQVREATDKILSDAKAGTWRSPLKDAADAHAPFVAALRYTAVSIG